MTRRAPQKGWCGIVPLHARSLVRLFPLLLLLMAGAGAGAEQTPAVQGSGSSIAPVEPAAAAPADAVDLVEAYYRDLADLRATISQKNYLQSIGKTQTFEGTLSIKKPGRLRLEYTNGQVIVIDGKEAWFYSKKSEQAIRRTFRDFEQANIPVAFLLGAANIREDFTVVARQEEDGHTTLDLTPKRTGAAMKGIGLVCDGDGRIAAMTIYDRSGNRSSISFANVRVNTGLSDALFTFKVPKGTEIIEQ